MSYLHLLPEAAIYVLSATHSLNKKIRHDNKLNYPQTAVASDAAVTPGLPA